MSGDTHNHVNRCTTDAQTTAILLRDQNTPLYLDAVRSFESQGMRNIRSLRKTMSENVII